MMGLNRSLLANLDRIHRYTEEAERELDVLKKRAKDSQSSKDTRQATIKELEQALETLNGEQEFFRNTASSLQRDVLPPASPTEMSIAPDLKGRIRASLGDTATIIASKRFEGVFK